MSEDRTYYVLYLVNECPYCRAAEEIISSKPREYYIRYFDWEDEILNEAKRKYSHRTVPIISKFTVVGDKEVEQFIGGYTDLVEHLKEGD